MAFHYNNQHYRSKKHPVLEHIFTSKFDASKEPVDQAIISFTLKDVSDGYSVCGISEPASISNTILDLTRKRKPIQSRLPQSIYSLGYDLRKKTGASPDGTNYAGEFVHVGIGNEISSWLIWPDELEETTISTSGIPLDVKPFLRKDEGALFSVIDYCDVLSLTLGKNILRVQHPVKWQPNEIDGLYLYRHSGQTHLLPIEAKALTTGDDVNMEQLQGAIQTFSDKFRMQNIYILPIAIQMITNGLRIATFQECRSGENIPELLIQRAIRVTFSPPLQAWR